MYTGGTMPIENDTMKALCRMSDSVKKIRDDGATVRDMFAMSAMEAVLGGIAGHVGHINPGMDLRLFPDCVLGDRDCQLHYAEMFYSMADAMMQARSAPKGETGE